jgi:hypothetical protein
VEIMGKDQVNEVQQSGPLVGIQSSPLPQIPRKAASVEKSQPVPVPVPPRRRRPSQTSLPHSASQSSMTNSRSSPAFSRGSASPMPLQKSKSTGFGAHGNLQSSTGGEKSPTSTSLEFDQPLVISIPIGTVPRQGSPIDKSTNKPPVIKPARTSLVKKAQNDKDVSSVSIVLPRDSAVCVPISEAGNKAEPIYATVDVSHKRHQLAAPHVTVTSHPLCDVTALEAALAEKEAQMRRIGKEIDELKLRIAEAKRSDVGPQTKKFDKDDSCSFCHQFFAYVVTSYENGRLHADAQFMTNLGNVYDAFVNENSSVSAKEY